MHHKDRSSSRRERIEGLPHIEAKHVLAPRVHGYGRPEVWSVAAADGLLPPLIAADIHQDPDEPSLFGSRNGPGRRLGHPEKRLLNEVECLVRARTQPAGEPVQACAMGREQPAQPLLLRRGLCSVSDVLTHGLLNG
jgi:hypothetical protein